MTNKNDSKAWTGDYSTSGHYPLASAAERRLQRRVMRYVFAGIALLVLGLSIWQVLS